MYRALWRLWRGARVSAGHDTWCGVRVDAGYMLYVYMLMAPRVVQPYARGERNTAHSDGSEAEGERESGGGECEGANDLRRCDTR